MCAREMSIICLNICKEREKNRERERSEMEFQLHCATWERAYKNVFAYKMCVKIVRIVCSADNLASFPLDLSCNWQGLGKICVAGI